MEMYTLIIQDGDVYPYTLLIKEEDAYPSN